MIEKEIFGGLIRLHVLYHASHEKIFGLGIIEEQAEHGTPTRVEGRRAEERRSEAQPRSRHSARSAAR